ncbi:ATP-dependent Clp protease ATP-binding subunit ClpA [Magnetococcus marinus MC-1]|uniref:ATP-dependent Clp protease ATP-binding subunit ClpA n=1 Tax=Magnetococcus marinus (strain ATCC BAA-1437 / JCM 17883 / MC-1) TaxID=156889 RepID=A0L8H5_MAGMM|nr:ATP-dependent Clp protease ATP-binding subunit ClpA [Magnetococcus marinus]ABK44268.1 ATP-dependent Clp protease ATP-binding subunit ClpA [Magnetococcus marinus MC-1]
MISKHLETSLNKALQLAHARRHQFATLEHLLLALLDNPEVVDILIPCGCDMQQLNMELAEHLEQHIPLSADAAPSIADITPTIAFQRVIQRAVQQVQSSGRDMVTGAYVLVAMFNEKDAHAVYFLAKQNINKLDVQSMIAHGGESEATGAGEHGHAHEGSAAGAGNKEKDDPLAAYTVNLNIRAQEGKIDPLIGRENEIRRTLQILCRRRKNNPLYVGDAGVGKTHLAEGLALKIVNGEVPEILADAEVFSLDMGSLLAGTKYRGDFESRLKNVLRALKERPKSVLFIDEIHTVIGAGATSGSTMDASNLLKPMLQNGELRCIGSTTFEEYRTIFEQDRALARRFQKVDVLEPSLEETIKILKGLKIRFEDHHGVRFTNQALQTAAELSARHINDRKHPDSAIDVIDEAGAASQLLPLSKRKKSIGVKEIEQVVALMARIPTRSVSKDDRQVLRNLDKNLRLSLFGQDGAIDKTCEAIKLNRSGLGNPEKPIGSFLFAGPTGVGKTELARLLAAEMGVELIRFDMSEYMERHAVSRLIGAPPGYVGFEQGGLLTDAVTKNPHSVLLLDEIEKAHPDVFNILLQVMDHGKLTDNNGRQADFRNVVLIMTTNAGASDLERASVGFVTQTHVGDDMKAINQTFAPEFRNRLDAIIPFVQLNRETILRVVDKFLVRLETQLEEKGVALFVDDSARHLLAKKGYDKKHGARPMERAIQQELRKPLSDELLFGKLVHGGAVHVSAVEAANELAILVEDSHEVEKAEKTSEETSEA